MPVLEVASDSPLAVQTAPPPELTLFQPPLLQRRAYWRSFLASAVLHGAVIFGLPPLMDLLPENDAEIMRRHMQAMRPLEIRVPDRLYLSSLPPEPDESPAQRRSQQRPEPKEVAKAELPPQAAPRVEPLRLPPRQFKPPANVRRVDADQTLLQAHLPPELLPKSQVKLPQLILMSGPVFRRPAPRRFVEPGRSAAPVVVPRVDAPPPLAASSDSNPDLRINSMLAGPQTAQLRLPRPNVPARKFQAPAPVPAGRGASVVPMLGEPVNILALSSDPAPLQDRLTVPLGNQIGRLPALPAYPEAPPVPPPPKATGSGKAAPSSASGTKDAGGGAGKDAGLSEFAKALAALPARYATPIKVEHPANGVFDIVVTQSSSDPAFTESAGVLTGQPVYSVYLQVGAPRAWVLQYCVPREVSPAPQVAEGVVNIGNPSPLKAPLPLVTVLPPVTMLPRNGYIIVHGSLNASGQLTNLVVMRAPNAKMNEMILSELGKWQFRPAVRDGAPVTVEILLAIPPQDV
ncbi:MAG: hypothetical protein EHM65_00260 [Acidobacteriales bacterium]|nr:MAG: hypothetical protein EHM65_00260 [Terriglobales bacterium]